MLPLKHWTDIRSEQRELEMYEKFGKGEDASDEGRLIFITHMWY